MKGAVRGTLVIALENENAEQKHTTTHFFFKIFIDVISYSDHILSFSLWPCLSGQPLQPRDDDAVHQRSHWQPQLLWKDFNVAMAEPYMCVRLIHQRSSWPPSA